MPPQYVLRCLSRRRSVAQIMGLFAETVNVVIGGAIITEMVIFVDISKWPLSNITSIIGILRGL